MSLPFDVDDLRKRVQAGEVFSYRHFYGHTPRKDGCLSNAVFSQFYQCRFEVDGQVYRWAEQWMMAGKARLFDDEGSLQKIMAARSAQDCKQLGREVANYDDTRWSDARFDLVTQGSAAKFGQDAALKDYLLATGDELLVEAAPQDRIWGIGLDRDDPDASNPLAWRGLNLLGFALVRARSVLREELQSSRHAAGGVLGPCAAAAGSPG